MYILTCEGVQVQPHRRFCTNWATRSDAAGRVVYLFLIACRSLGPSICISLLYLFNPARCRCSSLHPPSSEATPAALHCTLIVTEDGIAGGATTLARPALDHLLLFSSGLWRRPLDQRARHLLWRRRRFRNHGYVHTLINWPASFFYRCVLLLPNESGWSIAALPPITNN